MKRILKYFAVFALVFAMLLLTACEFISIDESADISFDFSSFISYITESSESGESSEPVSEISEESEISEISEVSEVSEVSEESEVSEISEAPAIDVNGIYTTKEDVALYIHTYGHLPSNFVTKKFAESEYGWKGGGLEKYAHGMCIGGDYYGNYEGLLPKKKDRHYYECDIDTLYNKKSRGEKRIVYSDDGLIYYTDDHYESFTLLYGEE